MSTTVLFKNTIGTDTKIFSNEFNVMSVTECKSFAGKLFNEFSTITSASVIDNTGNEVLLLEKDAKGKCTRRISK